MKSFSLLIKPAGPDCNIDCGYCFYSSKSQLFGTGKHRMDDETLEKLVKDLLQLELPISAFAFQGGEPTLMGLDFYRKLISYQKKYARPGQIITNSLQTNGILLDEQWCRFLHKYKFLIGISLDGPEKYHNYYRLDHSGKPTWQKVMAGIENCKKYQVDYNILVLLNNINADHPDELFDFFIKQHFKYLQFIPCVEMDSHTGQIASFSVSSTQYGDFLCRIFDRWMKHGPTKTSIRIFDSIISYLLNGRHTECTLNKKCDDYVVVEHNGDVYCCDFFVEPQWKLGNIMQDNIGQIATASLKNQFSRRKRHLPSQCELCRYLNLCRGGCPKDRIVESAGKPISYLCPAYKKLFAHILPQMETFAAMLRSQQNHS